MVIPALYIHIPYCYRLCHYCDFAKTARYDSETVSRYFEAIGHHFRLMLRALAKDDLMSFGFESVFLGGGTPSMFAKEYEALFQELKPFLAPDCEITLEANPEDLQSDRMEVWRSFGVNRLSVGVQSFDAEGLRYLSRTHSPSVCLKGLTKAKHYFENLNIDLIYGWPGQSQASWQQDLSICLDLQIPHLSLYNLTYEPGTVLGRRLTRGMIESMPEPEQLKRYEEARHRLDGFDHDEVSNWSRSGFSCRHNWYYWSDQHYLAIGTGAHGYLPTANAEIGCRYFHPKNRLRLQTPTVDMSKVDVSIFSALGYQIEQRSLDDWLLEVIASGIRTRRGIPLSRLRKYFDFIPTNRIKAVLDQGLIYFSPGGNSLCLDPREWIREMYWASELAMSYRRKLT